MSDQKLEYPEVKQKFDRVLGAFFIECLLVFGSMMYTVWAALLLIGHAGGLGQSMAIWGLQMGIVGAGYMVAMPLFRLIELKLPLRQAHLVVFVLGLFTLPFLLLDMSKPGIYMNWWFAAIPVVMAVACFALRYTQYQKGQAPTATN